MNTDYYYSLNVILCYIYKCLNNNEVSTLGTKFKYMQFKTLYINLMKY